jgi:hypothetical protein
MAKGRIGYGRNGEKIGRNGKWAKWHWAKWEYTVAKATQKRHTTVASGTRLGVSLLFNVHDVRRSESDVHRFLLSILSSKFC